MNISMGDIYSIERSNTPQRFRGPQSDLVLFNNLNAVPSAVHEGSNPPHVGQLDTGNRAERKPVIGSAKPRKRWAPVLATNFTDSRFNERLLGNEVEVANAYLRTSTRAFQL